MQPLAEEADVTIVARERRPRLRTSLPTANGCGRSC